MVLAEKEIPQAKQECWPRVKFGDIAQEVKVSTNDPASMGLERYVGLEHLDPESLRLQRWGLIEDDNPSFTRVFKAGQVLFGKRRCYQKKAAIADFDGICSGDIIVLEPKGNALLPELLPFIIQSDRFFEWAEKTSSGSLSPRTKFKNLAEYEFPLPPRPRQEEMLKMLIQIEEASFTLLEAETLRYNTLKALLLKIFPNHFEKHLKSYTPLNDDWKKYKLGELLIKEPESGYSANEIDSKSDWHVLNLNCLSRSGFQNNDYKPIAEKDFIQGKKLFNGDFLISRSNTKSLVGLVGIYKDNEREAIFPDTMMRLQLNKELIIPEFLEMYLLSPFGRRQITRLAAGTSPSMVKINKYNLNTVPVPVPDKKAQMVLVTCYKVFEDHKFMLLAQQKKCQTLRQKFLDYYLERIKYDFQ